MNKTLKILELIWLIMGIVGIFMCAYFSVLKDKEGALYFLIFTLACGIMYTVRKRQRKKFEATKQSNSMSEKK